MRHKPITMTLVLLMCLFALHLSPAKLTAQGRIGTIQAYTDSLEVEIQRAKKKRMIFLLGTAAGVAVSSTLHLMGNANYDNYQHAQSGADALSYWDTTKRFDRAARVSVAATAGLLSLAAYHHRHAGRLRDLTDGVPLLYQQQYGERMFSTTLHMQLLSTGDLVLAGSGQHADNNVNTQVICIDDNGAEKWHLQLGGPRLDLCQAMVATEGGVVVVNETRTAGGQEATTNCTSIDLAGNIVWEQTIATGTDRAIGMVSTDSGFVVLFERAKQPWVLPLDMSGQRRQERRLASAGQGVVYGISRARSGGFVIAGASMSQNGAPSLWLLQGDSAGNALWERNYAGEKTNSTGYAIAETRDGGCAVIFTAGKGRSPSVTHNTLLMKMDRSGETEWQREVSHGTRFIPWRVRQARNGGYVVFGELGEDAVFIMTDSRGEVVHRDIYENSSASKGMDIAELKDGSFVLLGARHFDSPSSPQMQLLRTYRF